MNYLFFMVFLLSLSSLERIYYKSDVTFVFAYYYYVRASLPLECVAFAFKSVSINSVSS